MGVPILVEEQNNLVNSLDNIIMIILTIAWLNSRSLRLLFLIPRWELAMFILQKESYFSIQNKKK